MEQYQYFVNISDLTTIKSINLTIFQLTMSNKIDRYMIINAQPNRIDGKVALIKSDHIDIVKEQKQLEAICFIFKEKFKLRCYRRKITSNARPKIF